MNRENWRRIITESCEKVGTNEPQYEPVMDTLAGILEKRDLAEAEFEASGGECMIVKINTRSGEPNQAKNPALSLYMDLNTQALAYWRDLGLTPAGLKKINADALNAKATSDGFEALLAKIAK